MGRSYTPKYALKLMTYTGFLTPMAWDRHYGSPLSNVHAKKFLDAYNKSTMPGNVNQGAPKALGITVYRQSDKVVTARWPPVFYNPGRPHHTAKWRRMVRAIKRRGGSYSPYAVATARLGPSRLNPMNLKGINQFFNYVWSFYGPGEIYGHFFRNRLTKKELRTAIAQYVRSGKYQPPGDSVDREFVRDILLAMPKYRALKNPFSSKTKRKALRVATRLAYHIYKDVKAKHFSRHHLTKRTPKLVRKYAKIILDANGIKMSMLKD